MICMKQYELTYLASPDLSEEELKALGEKINSFVAEAAGISIRESSFLRKKLAFLIKRKGYAHLNTLIFQLNPEKLESFEKNLKAQDQVLRYLILAKRKPGAEEIFEKRRRSIRKKEPAKVEMKEIEKKLEEILGQ